MLVNIKDNYHTWDVIIPLGSSESLLLKISVDLKQIFYWWLTIRSCLLPMLNTTEHSSEHQYLIDIDQPKPPIWASYFSQHHSSLIHYISTSYHVLFIFSSISSLTIPLFFPLWISSGLQELIQIYNCTFTFCIMACDKPRQVQVNKDKLRD